MVLAIVPPLSVRLNHHTNILNGTSCSSAHTTPLSIHRLRYSTYCYTPQDQWQTRLSLRNGAPSPSTRTHEIKKHPLHLVILTIILFFPRPSLPCQPYPTELMSTNSDNHTAPMKHTQTKSALSLDMPLRFPLSITHTVARSPTPLRHQIRRDPSKVQSGHVHTGLNLSFRSLSFRV